MGNDCSCVLKENKCIETDTVSFSILNYSNWYWEANTFLVNTNLNIFTKLIICRKFKFTHKKPLQTNLTSTVTFEFKPDSKLEHWCVTIRWTGMLRSVCVQTSQRLPEVDYRVDEEVEWNCEESQLDQEDTCQLYQGKIYTSLGFISKINIPSHWAGRVSNCATQIISRLEIWHCIWWPVFQVRKYLRLQYKYDG